MQNFHFTNKSVYKWWILIILWNFLYILKTVTYNYSKKDLDEMKKKVWPHIILQILYKFSRVLFAKIR